MARTSLKAPLFGLAFAIFWALTPASSPVGEAHTVRATARALAFGGTLDVAALGDGDSLPHTVVHAGRRRATGDLGAALVLVPAELLARATVTIDRAGRIERLAESATAATAAACLCVLFCAALRRHGLSPAGALGFTAALALATPIVFFARVPDGTALSTLLLYWALVEARAFVAAPRGGELGLGLTLGALVVVNPTLTLAALAMLAWCGLHRHQRFAGWTALETLGPVAAGVVIVLLHRWHVGAGAEATGNLWQGLVGFVLSPGKSLFVYAPLTLLAIPSLVRLWRGRRQEAELLLVVMAAVLLATARLDDWHGDPTWGPRRIVPLVPLAVEAVALAWCQLGSPARRRRHALPLGLLVAAGLFVSTVGVALPPPTYLEVLRDVRVATGAPGWFAVTPDEAHFIPQFSPVVGHAWLLSHLIRHSPRFDVGTPWKLLIQQSPPMPELLPRLQIDWIGRQLPIPLLTSWLLLLCVAATLSTWVLKRRLVIL
jgi:hypothetical protein